MDGEQSAGACAAVAKLLGNALVVRGSQLSVLSAVSGTPLVELHESLVKRYLNRLGDASLPAESRRSIKSTVIFKSLTAMLTSAKPKDAIAM